jgi:transcriptional regulator with XRE-family HTH domain
MQVIGEGTMAKAKRTGRAPAQTFSDRLKVGRAARHLGLAGLAEMTGLSKTYLWELESQVPPPTPSAEVLAKLADALGVSMDFLWRGKPEHGLDVKGALLYAAGVLDRLATTGRLD